MRHIYWVGVKESEIQTCKHLFDGSVTFIGSGKDGNISFSHCKDYIINYNEDSIELDNFMRETLHSIILKIPDVSFFCYTTSYIYSLEDIEINEHIICKNRRDTLQLLRNKMDSRLWLKQYVPVLPTIILSGSECKYANLCSLFPHEKTFTIQGCTGAGGIDTYVMSINNHKSIINRLHSNHIYLISPYKENSYSINIHILFTENNYYTTPGSIQIVEHDNNRMIYRGCDFIAYRDISQTVYNKILEYTQIIAEKMQLLPYIGLMGIDFLISDNEVFFLEINPRFQSSSFILNLALEKNNLPSLQEIILDMNNQKSLLENNILENLKVDFSCYIVDYKSSEYDYKAYLQNVNNCNEVEQLALDGYYNNMACQDGASIFSIVFNEKIISINPNGGYNIYDNIKPYPLKKICLNTEKDCIWLKFAIMNQGIQFSDKAKSHFSMFQKGVYSSLDIYINDYFIINAPVEIPFYSLSPFKIDYIDDKLILLYGDNFINNISIRKREKYCDLFTKNKINFQNISFIATDRLRIHHSPNCLFQTQNSGCKFCDVSGDSISFDETDIYEVIDWHLNYSAFNHILIGGASGEYPQEYERIQRIIKYIRSKTDKPIYIMTLPPTDLSILDQYYDLGVSEVAYNIEIYNRTIATKIMPGKGMIPLPVYQNALLHSVKLWGNTGKVRSILIYGLEPDVSFFEGIEWLASNGIQPIISPFRALKKAEYANIVPPNTNALIQIYNKATTICQRYNLNLGPSCIYCQNNTLSFDARIVFHYDN